MKALPVRGKTMRRLGALFGKVLAGVAFVHASLVPRAAQATKTSTRASFGERAQNVKKAIDQMAPGMKPNELGPHLMQWYKWGNWNNWPNWGNWNNWNNWFNWLKY
jgi:hypothetical protein